jgi:DNA-binding IclR family transcriptional regulator
MYQKVKSVVRALKIMELLREKSLANEFVSPREAAEAAGVSAVSAYNILNTLAECGYARHSGRGKYEEGGRETPPTRGPGIINRLREAAKPLLCEAAASGKESFLLVTLNNGKRVELLRIGKIKNSRAAVFEANSEPYAMRTVRAILAWYNPAQLDFFIRRNGLPSNEDWRETNETRSGLLRELKGIRERGGCCDLHLTRGMTATAVPILLPGGEVVGSLGCYSPLRNTDRIRQRGIFQLLQEMAAEIGSAVAAAE